MKIKALTLQDIRSYDDQTVEFPDGTILIRGDNGAGKTSLLMGIFGGLFLSKIRNVGTNDFNLGDLVRRGEDKGTVELVFEIDGTEYTVTWELYTTSTPNSATLDSESFSDPVTGIEDVRAEVIGLLGMDEDDFSSSVYVKQGEIDRLIEAGDRAEMIDSLLGLDELDEYIDRMKAARRGAGRVQKQNQTSRENYQDDLDDIEKTEPEYEDEIHSLTDDIADLETDIDEIEEFIDELKDHRTSIKSDIEDYEDLQERKAEKQEQIEEAQAKRADQQSTINESETAIQEAQDEINTLEGDIEDLDTEVEYDLRSAESAADANEAVQDAYIEATTERNDCENALQNAQVELDRFEDERSQAITEREELIEERDALQSDLDDTIDRLAGAETERESLTTERNESAAAFLPTIADADEVTDDHEETVESRLAELRDKREDVTATKREVTTKRDRAEEDLETAREELETATDDLADAESQLETVLADLAAAEDDLTAAETEFEERVETLADQASDFDVEVTAENLDELRDSVIPEVIEETNAGLNEAGNAIAEHRNDKQRYEEELTEIKELGEQDKCPKCGKTVEDSHIENEVNELEAAITDVQEAIEDAQETETELEARKEALQAFREDLLETITYRDETLAAARDEMESLHDEEDGLQSRIEALKDTIQNHESTIADLESDIDDLEEQEATLDAELSEVNAAIETGEEVLDAFGKVADQQETVANLEDEISDIETDIENVNDEIADVDGEIEELEDAIKDQETVVGDSEAALEAAEERVEETETVQEAVEEAVAKYDTISELRTTIEQEQQAVQHARDRIDDLNSQIARLQGEKEDIEEQLGDEDVEDLREDLERVNTRIEQRQETRDEYQEKLQETRDERTRLETELESLCETKAQIELYEDKEQWAKEVHDELDAVISVYESTKSDLREQYLAYINEYTNDIFKEIYKNSSYQQVIIEETYDDRRDSYEYDIRLLRDDGTTEDPSNASGGERAIVNLALRAGIYKLIAELHGGNRGQLPPFILDEPTTFLDEGHVGQLEQMLTTIKGWDVPQIIVVSHDEALIHGADHECHVTIDESDNTSQITMRTAGAD